MSDRIKENSTNPRHEPSPNTTRPIENERLAIVCGLMVATARMDGDFGDGERTKILELLHRRYSLTPKTGQEVLEASEAAYERAGVIHSFVKAVKQSCSRKERVEVLEMSFEVVFSDGVVHGHEAALLRHLAKEFEIPDDEYRDLRKQIMKRLGLQGF